ncbi:hypothetical protein SAMN06295905_2363 [Devosia lucknowensis]|uniref:Uncharacterized protein n=1 Tax=Devosia lucknowensis TaxID=1096929 RepID=A0A1Y6FSY4_9HYPH|nr:hypothetical protein [Devosia lucknowensis]SMQ75643.1 hypothetical protein SAMN06295905_2363 [Devosia lucknowensis]
MVRQADRILEGVSEGEVASLRALADGHGIAVGRDIAPLHAKGWVDVIGGDAIITLTGRTLLERNRLG